jgi:two-component system capsular synthesis sensor histidine kinase RcsC
VLAPDGSLVVACPDAASAALLPLARQAQAAGLDKPSRNVFLEGHVLSGWPLLPTGWTLVHAQSWRDIVTGVRTQIILAALTSAVIIALTWALLLLVKWRVFVPAVRQSQRVFDSEQLSRTLVETAPVGLGLITANTGQPLLRSPSMIATNSRVVVDGPGLSYALSRHFLQQEKLAPPQSGGAAVFEDDLTFSTRDGQRLDLSVSMVRARYQDEDVLVTAFTDVTADKQLEQELRNARQAADSANAAKSAFLAAMSHEIRTPLNAVLGNLELLAYSPLDELQRDRLNTIRNASDGLLAVVSDVLDFSKIEAGELQLEDQEFDVLELASQTLMMFAPVARAKKLALAGELGDTLTWPLRGDPARLGQVMNNLLSNAIKFTETGQVTLRLSRDEAASQVLIEVEDTGIGISADQLPALFQDFTQADATITRRFGGTGLGLALCQRLAQAMGGTLTVQSQPGVGSRFTLRLPLHADASTASERPRFDGEPVLLVAAIQAERTRLGSILQAWGVGVTSYAHPALIAQESVEDASALVFWGDRKTWHPSDENRLVEDASWVVDCSEDGPAQPVASGRVISASVYGLHGLASGLQYALQGRALAAQAVDGMVLGKRLRVLVAEDNVVNRKLFEEQLALLGCDATAVPDAEQALACLEQDTFDVLLTDLAMPGQDGFALARQVRQRWPAMPVMAATANVTPQEREAGERAGMARVLGKPLSLADLGLALSEVAGLPPLRRDALAGSGLLGGRPVADATWQVFVQSCRDAVQALQDGLRAEDGPRLLAELHSLGGACAVFGLNDIAARGAALAQSISAQGVRACEAEIHALGDALLAVVLQEPLHLINVADQIIARLETPDGSVNAASVAELAKTLRAGLHDCGGSRAG